MDHLDRDELACRVEAKQRQRPCHWVVLLVVVAVVALLVVVAVVAMSVATPISVPTRSCFVVVMAYEEMTVATSEARTACSEVLAMQRHGKGRDKDVRREATRAEKPRMHKSQGGSAGSHSCRETPNAQVGRGSSNAKHLKYRWQFCSLVVSSLI